MSRILRILSNVACIMSILLSISKQKMCIIEGHCFIILYYFSKMHRLSPISYKITHKLNFKYYTILFYKFCTQLIKVLHSIVHFFNITFANVVMVSGIREMEVIFENNLNYFPMGERKKKPTMNEKGKLSIS